jgi:hypothetical protein
MPQGSNLIAMYVPCVKKSVLHVDSKKMLLHIQEGFCTTKEEKKAPIMEMKMIHIVHTKN